MADHFLRLARQCLRTSDLELARKLEISTGCVRSWDRHGAPRYARLAVAALMIGVDPDVPSRSLQPVPRVKDADG